MQVVDYLKQDKNISFTYKSGREGMVRLKSVLAKNIKARRKALGLTQEALAEMVGTVSTYIAMIESEKRTPSFTMIERIAKALKIDAPELFSTKDYPLEKTSQLREDLIHQFDLFLRAAIKEIEGKK